MGRLISRNIHRMRKLLVLIVVGTFSPMASAQDCGSFYCPGSCFAHLQQLVSGPDALVCSQEGGCTVKLLVSLPRDPPLYYAGTYYSLINEYGILVNGPGDIYTGCSEYDGAGGSTPATLAPVTSQNSPICPAHSTINTDSLALGESIPIVGAPFSLNYSSDRFRSGVNFSPTSLGIGGWTPSLIHHSSL